MIRDHDCWAGDNCRGRQNDADGRMQPAATELSDTLCEPCILAVEGAVTQLWSDYLALMRGIGESTRKATAGIRRPQPSSRPTINVHRLALMSEIVEVVDRCAEQVADILHIENPEVKRDVTRFAKCLGIIETNIHILAKVGTIDTHSWSENGTYWGAGETSGPELALRLVELHRRARSQLGLTRGRDRMPVPCPRCSADALGRWHGAAEVDCLDCGRSWTEEQYQSFCLITAQIEKRRAESA